MDRCGYHASRSPLPFLQHRFCVQFYQPSLVSTKHPLHLYENNIHGSTNCAGNSIHFVCCRDTSIQIRVVLNIINSAMQSYTQLQNKTPYKIFLIIHKYFFLNVKQCWPNLFGFMSRPVQRPRHMASLN